MNYTKDRLMSLKEFSRFTCVSVNTLKAFDRKCILKPYKVDSRGNRYYLASQLNDIVSINFNQSKTLVFYYTNGSDNIRDIEDAVYKLKRKYKGTGVCVEYTVEGLKGYDSVLPLDVLYRIFKGEIDRIILFNYENMGAERIVALKDFTKSCGCALVYGEF